MKNAHSAEPLGDKPRPANAPASRVRRVAVPALAATLAVGAAQVALAAPGRAATAPKVTVGHAAVLPHGATAAAAPAGSAKLNLEIQLTTPNSANLAKVAQEVNDPKSPYYRQYLSKGQVAQYFGASSAEVSTVDAALKAAGLTPGPVSSDGLFIPITATVAQAQSAFDTTLAGYRVAGRTVYANTSAPKFDASIASDVANVVGLDNIAHVAPHDVATSKTAAAHLSGVNSNAAKPDTVKPNAAVKLPTCAAINNAFGSGPQPLHDGTDYYTADAVSKIYGLNSVLASGDGGAGVTVAVFELESLDVPGYQQIADCYDGTHPNLTQISVDGGPSQPADLETGVGIEAALDVENIADLAPNVTIRDYQGPDWQVATDAQVLDTYRQIATDDVAKVVSTSWGLCEQGDASDSTFIQSESAIFNTMAIQGQSVVAASGDSGSTDCFDPNATNPDKELAVDDPASQPTVLGVGGTSMKGLTNPPQSVWNSVQTDSNGNHSYGAGGGGVSVVEAQPTFQQGVAGSGYSAHCTIAGGTCRQVPDVSALADPTEGYVINEFDSAVNDNLLEIIGGTSGAAPTWAAVLALADASTSCNGVSAGEVAPALYNAAAQPSRYSVFRDITTGNNGISAYGATFAYPATAGYDLASGWGVPNATGVVTAVCGKGLMSAASYYQPVGPTRILDTRKNQGATGPVGKTGTIKLQITGQNGVAPSNVTAVALNVTVTGNTGGGFATVYPDGGAVPATSNLDWNANSTVPNMVVVPVGTDGKVDITNNSSASAQFLGDLAGYFTSDGTASGVSTYTAAGPVRLLDTRHGVGGPTAKVGAKASISLQVGGTTVDSTTIPSGITAVAMNVTVTNPGGIGFLTVYPNQNADGTATTLPTVSNLDFAANQTIANLAIVPVGADGKVDFYNGNSQPTDVLADVAGYFTAGTGGSKYVAVGPDRIMDTRSGLGASGAGAIGKGGTKALPLPPTITSVLANLTVTAPQTGGYLTAYPSTAATRPVVSNLDFNANQTVPNLAIVPTGTNGSGVSFYNGAGGTSQLIVDLGGFFTDSAS